LGATKIYKTYGIASRKVFAAVQFEIFFCQVELHHSIIGARRRRRVRNILWHNAIPNTNEDFKYGIISTFAKRCKTFFLKW